MMFVVWKSVFKFVDLNLSSLLLRHLIIFNILDVPLPQIYACPQVTIGMHFIVFDLKQLFAEALLLLFAHHQFVEFDFTCV
jgi:hypothetical protein